MIPMPDSNIDCSMSIEEGPASPEIQHYVGEKSEVKHAKVAIQLCSTPPLSMSPQNLPKFRKGHNCSPAHFSKKERILQSLMTSPSNNVPKEIFPERKALKHQASESTKNYSTKEVLCEKASQNVELEAKQTCLGDNSTEKPTVTFSGKLTWLLVGENGKVLWREAASKEKVVSI